VNLFNILLLMFSSVWAGKATSFESLLAARFFMGVGVGPADTSMFSSSFFFIQLARLLAPFCSYGCGLVCSWLTRWIVAPNIIGEIYFTHQRGKAMVCLPFCCRCQELSVDCLPFRDSILYF
jgi:hypothetical protein